VPSAMRDPKTIVREGYDLASRVYRGDTLALDARSGYAHWLRRLSARLPAGARVLDLGCGNGIPVARELVKRHAVTGVDLSPVQVRRARALVPEARFVCADMTRLGLRPASFEAVTAFYSIINVPLGEQRGLIDSIVRWLVPGGWVLAIVGRVAWTGTERDWRGVAGATMYWSHGDVATYRAWFRAAGLSIEEEGVQPERGNPGFAVLIARRRG